MATGKKEVKYCFYCGKNVTRGKKNIICENCRQPPKKFSVPIKITPEELERTYKDVMVYCYNCSEELIRSTRKLLCSDGCDLIEIEFDQVPISPVMENKEVSEETNVDTQIKSGEKSVESHDDTFVKVSLQDVPQSSLFPSDELTQHVENQAKQQISNYPLNKELQESKQLQHHNIDETAILKKAPDENILKRFSGKLAVKWKRLGKQLGVPNDRVRIIEVLKPQESYDQLLDAWKDTAERPYIWETFLNALRSPEVDEHEIANDIYKHLLGFYDVKDLDQAICQTNLLSQRGVQKHWFPINLFVIVDESEWYTQFNVGIRSPDMEDGKVTFPFKCIHQQENFQIYHYKLQINDEHLYRKEQKVMFRYSYAFITEGKYYVPEVLSFSASWRIVEITSLDAEYMQYDPVIITESMNRFKFWKKSALEFACNAFDVYLDWASNEQQWMIIHTSNVLGEFKQKGKDLSLIIGCLSNAKHLVTFGTQANTAFFLQIEEKFLKKMAEKLSPLSGLDRFYAGFIFIEALNCSSIFNGRTKCLEDDITSTVELVKSFYIPVNDFEKAVTTVKNLDKNYKDKTLFPALITLCIIAIQNSQYEWMGLLPLLHVIKHNSFVTSKPFYLPLVENDVEQTLFCELQILTYLDKLSQDKRIAMADDAFNLVKPYFQYDWLMLRAFIATCPFQKLIYYVQNNPEVSFFACWVLYFKHLEEIELDDQFTEVIKGLSSQMKNVQAEKNEYSLCYKGVNHILNKIAHCSLPNTLCLLKATLELALICLARWESPEHFLEQQVRHLLLWITKTHGSEPSELKITKEVQDWCDMLEIEMCDQMLKIWKKKVIAEILTRVNKVQLEGRIKLLTNQFNQNFVDALRVNILESVQSDAPQGEKACRLLTSLESCLPSQIVFILGAILSSKYSYNDISLASLFWNPLPKCLELYEHIHNVGILQDTEEGKSAQSICEEAITILQTFFKDLNTRQITPKVLDELSKVGDFIKVKEIARSFLNTSFLKESIYKGALQALESEFTTYCEFKKRNKKLEHFACTFQVFSKAESLKIIEVLNSDYTLTPVSDLWDITPYALFKYCPTSVPENVIEEVFTLTHCEGISSNIFLKMFAKEKTKYHAKVEESDVTFEKVVQEFWLPICSEFRADFQKLCDGFQLPLNKVAYFFENMTTLPEIEEELEKWCHAVEETNKNWIRDAARKIGDYQTLCSYSFTAKTLLQLKKTLGLTGDFSVVEALLQRELEDAKTTLASVDNTTANTASILKDIADSPHRRACLETFCSCIDLVEWIRIVAKNVGQLQNVIQIANQTMEGDLVRQLLQDLLKFGSAFAPLIYDVSLDENCETLINRCKSLWKFIDENPDLRKIAKSCNTRLGELKRVQEALSNFQSSNIEQMNLINTRGIYNIAAIPGRILHCSDDAIRLVVKMTRNQGTQKIFKLNDLKELQSKLVLVATENADDVHTFIETLSKIEQVAELLIKLQEAGYVDYTHFHLECRCSQYKKGEFDKMILEMKEALANWQRSVQSHRKKYPHLNYFTSQQLLNLQQEFGKLKKNPNYIASTKLKQLLLSITPQPDQSTITVALTNAMKEVATNCMSYGTKDQGHISTLSVASYLDPSTFNEQQKEIYDTLTEIDQYKVVVVLSAFSELGVDANEDSLRGWCMVNESKFEDISLPEIPHTIDEEEIPEDDPLVLELIEDAYDKKIAIEAVRIAKKDLQTAREIAADLFLGKEITKITTDDQGESNWNAATYPHASLTVKRNVPEGKYLSLMELGEILSELAYQSPHERGKKSTLKSTKHYEYVIERGQVNLIAVDAASVWKAILFLYMTNPTQSLPTYEEVIICTEETTVEEITLLWHRTVNDEDKRRLFCLVNADKLPYSISEEVLNNLEIITQGSKDFRLVIMISNKDQVRNYVASRLSSYLRKPPPILSDKEISSYIASHMCHNLGIKPISSSIQEREVITSLKSTALFVVSTRSGMGKSLHIKRMAEVIDRVNTSEKPSYVNIPIHGPEISVRHILEQMKQCMQDPTDPHPQLIHFNIAQSMVEQVDWLLFKLLVLGGLSDNYGNIWKIVRKQICVVECTLPKLYNYLNDDQKSEQGHILSIYNLLSFLPQITCFSPKESLDKSQTKKIVVMDELVFKEQSVQRVFQYLRSWARKDLENYQLNYDPNNSEDRVNECLKCIITTMSSNRCRDPSWAEVRNFIQFLNGQLHDCEQSPYCVVDELKGFKEFVVKFAILMAEEFTEPSLSISQVEEDLNRVTESTLQNLYSVKKTRSWDTCSHPYLFFNQDGHTMTFMGLWVDKSGNLIDFRTNKIMEKNFLDKSLRKNLEKNFINFSEDYYSWKKEEMILKLMRVLGINDSKYRKADKSIDLCRIDPDDTYILTIDNLMKMMAIHMKFRCGIPVIMMGETGCGKTRLLRYLCELQAKAFGVKTLICLKVHGGINNDYVNLEVEAAIKHALKNKKLLGNKVYTVLFFDEVNTTEALGLIKEVICDRTLYGKPIPDELKFAAACNPYRIHDEDTIKSLQSAGLGFYLRDEERIPKLGSVPLRKLVYRVLPLPPSMFQFVYDFGTVSGKTEENYIERIVLNQLFDCQLISHDNKAVVKRTVVAVLCECQKCMRDQKNECKYVSLRDIVRAMILFKWFLEKLMTVKVLKEKLLEEIMNKMRITRTNQDLHDITRALMYAVSVSYYARLAKEEVKEAFVQKVVTQFQVPFCIPGATKDEKADVFKMEVESIQKVFLNAMNVRENIAHNAALRENVFMMVVCIENRLPLFIVGKPGSSKSLAKSIVAESMQGQYSQNELLKNLKQVQLFPYQCNQFSTTSTLKELFQEAMDFQKSQDTKKFASVVVLEEIGLAEDAPDLPLKVLHPYLEDGTAGTNPDEMEIAPEERVAFIGISNWALDPAKMNRGIMVTRCPIAQEELVKSARGIANIVDIDHVRDELTKSFDALATMYRNICTKQEEYRDEQKDEVREFFGLRDFYTMIKMLGWKCIEKGAPPSPEDYRSVILRNFSGHPKINPLKEIPNPASLVSLDEKENEALELIKDSLEPLKIQHGDGATKKENRYLLFITENQSALRILQTDLLREETPYVFYGSSFPKDTEYTQVCVNINKIKVCMEKGYPVVLLNYEQIYESLYDVLNQCYTELPTGRYVDLGLRSYRIKCRVDPNFRLIIIAERSRVFTQFPTALINRLEKHFVVSETILTQKQKSLAKNLQKWVERFANIEHNGKRFLVSDAFVGYQDHTAASIILHVYQMLDSPEDDEVLKESITILLQTASVDALARLRSGSAMCDEETKDSAFNIYFDQQNHFSLIDCLRNCLIDCSNVAMIQVTTFGPLLTHHYLSELAVGLHLPKENVKISRLSDFDTEIDFCSEVRGLFESSSDLKKVMIVQCDYEDSNLDFIACAQHRLIDEMRRLRKPECGVTHVLFIIQLPRVAGGTAFTSFQGGPWTSIHIDELTCSTGANQVVKYALFEPLHKFFNMLVEKDQEVPSDFKISTRIRDSIQLAVSKIMTAQSYKNMERVIDVLLKLIPDNSHLKFDSSTFICCLLKRMGELLKERDDCIPNPEEWAVNTALNRHQLQANFTLVNSIKKLMDVQIQHILSYIVSQIDKNCNLDLLREVSNSSITKLWLSLFDDVKFLQFDYNAIATSSVPVTNLKRQNYCCKFPFSWEVIDQIEAAVGKSTRKCHLNEDKLKKTFTELLSTAANLTFYEHVEAVPLEDSQQLYQYYLHDYIRNLVLPFDETCMDSVYEILHKVINELVSTFEPAVLSQQPFPLINAIVGVHFAYGLMEKEVFWLAELSETFSELPNIVKEKELLSSGELIFHFEAVECVIDHLLPAKINWNDENMKNWILDFHSSKSAVESLLYLKGHNDASNKMLTKARSNWQKVVAVALLIEHVISQIPPDLAMSTDKFTFLRRYNNLLKNIKFSDPKILVQTIKQFQGIMKSFPVKHQPQCQICESYLNMKDVEYIPCNKSHMFCKSCFQISFEKRGPRCPCCDTPIPQEKEFPIPEKKRKEYELLKQVQQHCLDFFMELVSQCCFSQIAPEKPTDAFFKKLLDIVTDTEHEDYESLFPYEEDYVHSCPLVRSVLLQLLLEYDPQQVKMKLQESLAPIKEKHGNAYASDDQELTLLLIKSLEDGLHKENVMKTALNDQLHFANECLVNALNVFIDGDLVDKYQKSTSIEFMQCIAQVRFGMYFAAKMFFEYYCNPDQRKKLPRATEENLKKLRSNAQNLVEKGVLKEPKSFLMKQIVRQYGLPYLYKLGDLAEFQWFAPKLKDTDYFVIIGKEYTALRANWIFSKSGYKKSELLSELKSMSELKQVIVVLVLFKKFTADRTVTKVAEPGQKELTHFYKNLWLELDQENLSSLQVLNLNQKSEKLSKIIFTPWEPSTEKALAEIVIHFAAVLGALSHDKLLTPFVTILTQTAKSKEMYWPTMPDDILDVIVDATKDSKDTWWKCPNGHDYFIQNCGRPVVGEVKYCFCGAPIGGRGHHKPMEDNIKVSDKPFQCDRLTKYGHCFDPPDLQATDPIPERELSPLSNCIMRLLLHAVCVWVASSNDKAACEELSEVVIQNEPVPPEQILNFFWHHLEKDLQTLTRVTQQSFDDCVLFIHILIHKMLSVKHDIDIDTFLTSREARKNFEIYFDSIFIKPITKDIHDQIKNGRLCITADLEEDERTMMQMIYETLPITSTNIIPHLWIYRPQITIDHLAQSLQLDTTDRGLRILQEFLAKVTLLSALQYLPDIVQLQTSLYEICHHRIHQNDAKISLENFIKNYIPKGHDDQRSKFTKWAESFCSAWNIVRGELTPTLMDPNVTVTQEHMTIKQPLGYFLPMKQGEGACSIALAKYLARLQNDFIDLSWEKLKLKSISGKHEVPLSKIQHCQMISFEHQLSHVIFSHCKYSLKAGHGADVTYDYVALEKHILDRFVRGKPLIFCDIPIMSYYSDVLEALTFTKIRKTIPQLPLPQREKDNILYEMTRKHCLQSCIDIVNIALGFVQYCNWNPDIMMKRYMYTLRMDRKLPATIEEHCQLAHIISLWRILNVEQARKITRSKEDPFPGINEVFKQELTKEETETLKTALGPFDMDQFLEILYEFIVTQVKNRQEIEAEDSLIDSYIDACDYFHLEKIANFEEKFPKQFSLQHVTEIWKYAVKYKEDQQNK